MADADLQIKIVTTLDGKGAADAKRDIQSVVDTAKTGAKAAEQETSKWSLSKKALIGNLKALKHELQFLPGIGPIIRTIMNPVTALGIGLSLLAGHFRKVKAEIDQLEKPVEWKFDPRNLADIEKLTAALKNMGDAGKTAADDIEAALDRALKKAAIIAGLTGDKGVERISTEEGLRTAIKRQKAVISDREEKMGFVGDEVMPAFFDWQTKAETSAKAKTAYAKKLDMAARAETVHWDPWGVGWAGDKEIAHYIQTKPQLGSPAEVLDLVKKGTANAVPPARAALRESVAAENLARRRLGTVAPGVGTIDQAGQFIAGRETQLRAERDAARAKMFGYDQQLQEMNILPPSAPRTRRLPLLQPGQVWGPDRTPPMVDWEAMRANQHYRELGARQKGAHEATFEALWALATEFEDMKAKMKTILSRTMHGDR